MEITPKHPFLESSPKWGTSQLQSTAKTSNFCMSCQKKYIVGLCMVTWVTCLLKIKVISLTRRCDWGRENQEKTWTFSKFLSLFPGCLGWRNPSSSTVSLESTGKHTLKSLLASSPTWKLLVREEGRGSSCWELSQFASGSEVQGGGKGDVRQLGNVMPSTSFL